jgi:hypothetical protein
VQEVIAPIRIVWTLEAEDVGSHHFVELTPLDSLWNAAKSPRTKVGRVAFIAYRAAGARGYPQIILQTMPRFDVGHVEYERATGLDENFMVFFCDRR